MQTLGTVAVKKQATDIIDQVGREKGKKAKWKSKETEVTNHRPICRTRFKSLKKLDKVDKQTNTATKIKGGCPGWGLGGDQAGCFNAASSKSGLPGTASSGAACRAGLSGDGSCPDAKTASRSFTQSETSLSSVSAPESSGPLAASSSVGGCMSGESQGCRKSIVYEGRLLGFLSKHARTNACASSE